MTFYEIVVVHTFGTMSTRWSKFHQFIKCMGVRGAFSVSTISEVICSQFGTCVLLINQLNGSGFKFSIVFFLHIAYESHRITHNNNNRRWRPHVVCSPSIGEFVQVFERTSRYDNPWNYSINHQSLLGLSLSLSLLRPLSLFLGMCWSMKYNGSPEIFITCTHLGQVHDYLFHVSLKLLYYYRHSDINVY